MIWLLLGFAVAIVVIAVVLVLALGFVRVSRELRADEHSDNYF